MWPSSELNSVITGIKSLKFGIKDVNPDSTSVYTRLEVTPNGGSLSGNWQFNQDQNFTCNIGSNAFKLYNGDTLISSFYHSTSGNPCLFSNN